MFSKHNKKLRKELFLATFTHLTSSERICQFSLQYSSDGIEYALFKLTAAIAFFSGDWNLHDWKMTE